VLLPGIRQRVWSVGFRRSLVKRKRMTRPMWPAAVTRTSNVVVGTMRFARRAEVMSDTEERVRRIALARVWRNGQLRPEQRSCTFAPVGTSRAEIDVTLK
jgi:hypothetical protein